MGKGPPWPPQGLGSDSGGEFISGSMLEKLSNQLKAQDEKMDQLATKDYIDGKVHELESHMTKKTQSMITEAVMPVREDLDGLQKKFQQMETNGLSGESLTRIEKLEKMYSQLKKDADIVEQQKCSKIMVIGGWKGSATEKDRFALMDKVVKDLKITDKVVKKGCHKLSKAKGGGLASVTFIEFNTKGACESAIDEAKKKSFPGKLVFFKQKSKGRSERNDSLKDILAEFKNRHPEVAVKINWETREIWDEKEVVIYKQAKYGVEGKWKDAYQNAMSDF